MRNTPRRIEIETVVAEGLSLQAAVVSLRAQAS